MPNTRKRQEDTDPHSKLLKEGHIQRLDKSTSNCIIAPTVITVKKR